MCMNRYNPTTNPTQRQALAGISQEAYSYSYELTHKAVTFLLYRSAWSVHSELDHLTIVIKTNHSSAVVNTTERWLQWNPGGFTPGAKHSGTGLYSVSLACNPRPPQLLFSGQNLPFPPGGFARLAIRKLILPYLTVPSSYLRLKVNSYECWCTLLSDVYWGFRVLSHYQPTYLWAATQINWCQPSPRTEGIKVHTTFSSSYCNKRKSSPAGDFILCDLTVLCSKLTESTLCFTLHAAIKSVSIRALTKSDHLLP